VTLALAALALTPTSLYPDASGQRDAAEQIAADRLLVFQRYR